MIKSVFKIVLVLTSFILIGTSCNGSSVKSDTNKTVVSTSGDMPEWYITPPDADRDYVYFVGYTYNAANIQDGKNSAMLNASYEAISYVGVRVTMELMEKEEFTTIDDVESYIDEVYSSVGATGSANVEMKIIETYFEKYSNGTYDIAVLVGCSVDSIEKARENIEFLAAQQRENAQTALDKAAAYLDSEEVGSALEEAYNALFMAQKAAENSDLYEEAQILLYNILSSLSLSLTSSPRYAYIEGNSDDITVKVNSTYSTKPVGGIMLSCVDDNAKSKISANGGYITDSSTGEVTFNVAKLFDYDETHVLTGSEKPVELSVTFSLDDFLSLEEVNSVYYEKILSLLEGQAVNVELEINSEAFATPTGVVVVKVLTDSGGMYSDIAIRDEMQTAIGEIWTDMGYSIYTVNVPQSAVNSGKNRDNMKESVIRYLNSNYPDLKRVLYGLEVINDLGVKKFNMNSVQITLYLSLIDMETEEVIKTVTITDTLFGTDLDQGILNTEKEIKESLNEEMTSF